MMTRQKRRSGQILVLFALMMPMIFGFMALGVDVVYAMMVKATLGTAIDSAVLAGSRAIVNGPTAVTAAVNMTFNANVGQFGEAQPAYAPNPPVITVEADGSRSISLTGSAKSPTFFMKLFGRSSIDVKAYAKASRRDAAVLLVLDRSGSLVTSNSWDDVQAAATFFVQAFDNDNDKVGLVSFGTNAKVDYSPQASFKTPLTNMITTIHAQTQNYTNSALGMYMAYGALKTLNASSAENVIVFFTDGDTTALPGNFDVRTTGSYKCPSTPVEGAFHTDHTGSAGVYGIFGLQPTVPYTQNPDYTLLSGCKGPALDSDGTNGTNLLSGSFRSFWKPSISPTTPVSVYGLNSVSLSDTGNGHNLINIGENMLINVAQMARQDPLSIRVFTIGLGSDINEDALRRVANVLPYTIDGQPVGLYVHAPDHTQLLEAFSQVADSISHLVR